jgi:hypothetical protein
MCVPFVILVVETVILCGYHSNIGSRKRNIIWVPLVILVVETVKIWEVHLIARAAETICFPLNY